MTNFKSYQLKYDQIIISYNRANDFDDKLKNIID
jgi:hypothetical protein